MLEDHSQALVHWAQLGVDRAVLVNIDAHDDLRWIDPDNIQALKNIVRDRDWKALKAADSAGEGGLYHPGSFIYAASRLGMIREVYWIVPFPWFRPPVDVQRINHFLTTYGFPQESLSTFVLTNGCYHGAFDGIPLNVCGIEQLPDLDEPLIMSIDADFFPAMADWYGQDLLGAMGFFFSALSQQAYRIRDTVIAHSVNGGFCDVSRRWIAETCADMMTRADLATGPYPEIWLVKGLADIYYQSDRPRSLLDLTGRFLDKYPLDPCLMSYRCFALLSLGETDQAFELARRLAVLDQAYAFTLADLGQCLIDRGDIDTGLRFFQAAYDYQPGMNFRQKNLGDALFLAGRYTQALRYYNAYRNLNGPCPVVFSMGRAALETGDENQAARWFDQGVQCLKNEKYPPILSAIDQEALKIAGRFFQDRGQPDKVQFIATHPALTEPD